MTKFLVYPLFVLTFMSPMYPAQVRDDKGHQEMSGMVKQGDKETEAFRAMRVPSYKSLSNPYPGAMKPLSPGGWFVEVKVFGGGLTGEGQKEYLLITSEGDITIKTLHDYRAINLPQEVTEMDRLVKRAQPARWSATDSNLETARLCQECHKIILTLYRRQADEIQSGYQASWDETTTSRVIAEVEEIFREAERLRSEHSDHKR